MSISLNSVVLNTDHTEQGAGVMAAVYSDDHKFSRDLPPSPTPSSLFFAPIAVEGFKCGACVRINHVDCVTIMFLIIVIFGNEKNTCFLDLLLSLFIYKSNFHVF